MTTARIDIPHDEIAAFCRKWRITELALFGSVLRDDFRPDSDVDVLVTFSPDASKRFRDWLEMQDELELIFQRKVDLVSRRAVEESDNPFRKNHILRHMEPVYVA
jgi:predicted nucleotidyltransferase